MWTDIELKWLERKREEIEHCFDSDINFSDLKRKARQVEGDSFRHKLIMCLTLLSGSGEFEVMADRWMAGRVRLRLVADIPGLLESFPVYTGLFEFDLSQVSEMKAQILEAIIVNINTWFKTTDWSVIREVVTKAEFSF